jgi:DNA (cytosine-5)-methyltransferase 1
MRKPRLLDAFCGAGGGGKGYDTVGFEVVGIDHLPQPDYPFAFLEGDALDFLRGLLAGATVLGWRLEDFDGIHASPPCPVHSSLNGWSGDSTEPDLIPQTRELLRATGLPYVIENVEGAPLINPVRICGQALGLKVRRHRLFECNFPVMVHACQHPGPPVIVVGGSIGRKVFDPRRKAIAPTFEQAKEVMGMPWATKPKGVVNAIPPAYTEHIGGYLMAAVKEAQRVAA